MLFLFPTSNFLWPDGTPLSGGYIDLGVPVFADLDLSIPHSTPIVLNSAGRPPSIFVAEEPAFWRVLTPAGDVLYEYGPPGFCVTMTCRNGYDGDVGIAGYIDSTPPFQILEGPIPQETINDPVVLNTGGFDSNNNTLFVGSGSSTSEFPRVVPMAVGESRTFGNSEYGFYNFAYWFPCEEDDQFWVTSATFFQQTPWNIVVVIGPNATTGKRYTLTSGGDSPYTQELTVTRNSDIGE